MNNITKALLEDLQNDLNIIKSHESNIEVVWSLNKLISNIKLTQKLIQEELNK